MQKQKQTGLFARPLTWLCLGFVLLLSYFTYVHRFDEPQGFFWDENYYVADAQKELSGVFYMQMHPPLGKLLIALGEKLLDGSRNDTQFLTTDYARGDFTDGFSITGYRFFPVLLAWLTAPLLFFTFLLITRHPLSATLLSFLYIFDNALIVHGRGAMLDAPLLFFSMSTILLFLLLIGEWRKRKALFRIGSLLFGVTFAAAVTTKTSGLILILFLLPLTYILLPRWQLIGRFLGYSAIAFLLTFTTVWQIHFSLGRSIQKTLPNEGWYGASAASRALHEQGKQGSLLSFPVQLRDALQFAATYNRGIPRLDFSKPDENGSPFFLWPLGGRSINYRWSALTGGSTRYLYLQANPVVWFIGLLGVVLAGTLLLASVFFPPKHKPQHMVLLLTFLGIHVAYMLTMSALSRVLFLHNYFPALFLSFLLVGIVFEELKTIGRFTLTQQHKLTGLLILATCIFLSFQFYRPLTYFEPITDTELSRRAIFPFWGLTCAHCPRENPFAVVRKMDTATQKSPPALSGGTN